MASSYYDLVQAIANYYGVGSDQWLSIVTQGISSADAYNILKQVPNVEIAVSESGKVLSYSVNSIGTATSTSIGSVANSNLLPSVVESSNIIEVPGEFVAQEAGKVSVKSGIASAGNFVVKEVIPAVMAAGVGIQLGKAIDKALYNANPEYWDSIGLQTLNPDVWNDFIGTNSFGDKVARLLLGVKEDNTTQAYIDERAFAYMALALENNGWFSEAGTVIIPSEVPVGNVLNPPTSFYPPYIKVNFPFTLEERYVTPLVDKDGNPATFVRRRVFEDVNNDVLNAVLVKSPSNTQSPSYRQYDLYIAWKSKNHGAIKYTQTGFNTYYKIYETSSYTYPINTQYLTDSNNVYIKINGENVPYQIINNALSSGYYDTFLTSSEQVKEVTTELTGDDIKNLIFALAGGTIETIEVIEGVSSVEGTVAPNLTGMSTLEDVLESLNQTYPDIFANKVTNNVVQPDGSVIPYNYVPIPLPIPNISGNELNSNQPISSTPTQTNPKVDPNTAPSDLLDYVSGLLGKPITPTDVPTTGEGTTPPFVLPTGSASALFKIYNPTIDELNSFGGWLWSDNFIQQIKKLFNDPMQAIIGLHKVYCTPNVAGRSNIVVGYLDSGVPSNYIGSQYVDIECGSVDIAEYFGNVMDYEPFTKISIYLPFIGIVPLSTGEVMRSTISVTYHIDVLSGACLAEVNIKRDNAGGVLYTFTGDCAERYPISAGSYMSLVGAVAGITGGAIAGLTGGLGLLPVALGGISALSHASTDVKHTGSFSGNAGALGIKKPYLIITRKQSDLADSFPKIDGYPTNYSTTLGACSGYTVVENIHITGISATDEELKELKSLLQKGVIF